MTVGAMRGNTKRSAATRRWASVTVLVASHGLGASPALAGDKVAADALFQQARQLMAEGNYEEACPKFEASNRVDPAVGTQLNLALCLKQAGKTASAWSAFRSAAAAARDHKQPDRQAAALAEAAELEKQLKYLTVRVEGEARIDGLRVTLGSSEVVPSLWGAAFPADPGDHVLTFSAEGYESATIPVSIAEAATTIDAPVLRKLAPEPAPVAATTPPPAPPKGPPPPAPAPREEPSSAPLWIAGGATALMAVGVGVTGGLYLSERSTYDELNGDSSATPEERQAAYDRAQALSIANLVFVGAAIVGAGITGYLWFTRDDDASSDDAATLQLQPWAGPGIAGLAVGGRL